LEPDFKLVIVVRRDLGMSCGKIAAQVAHASVMAALDAERNRNQEFSLWLQGGQKKVIVKVKTLSELQEVERKARESDLPVQVVKDMGLTEVPPGSVTCISIGPSTSSKLDPVTGSLRLLRGDIDALGRTWNSSHA